MIEVDRSTQLEKDLEQFAKKEAQKARRKELDRLVSAEVFGKGGTLSITRGRKGKYSVSARDSDGKAIDVPDFAGVAPEIAEMLRIIVQRGFVMRFGGPDLRACLGYKPTRRSREVELNNLDLGNRPFSEAVSDFDYSSEEYLVGADAMWDY